MNRSYSDCSPVIFFFFSSRRRHTRSKCDWSSDVCSSDLAEHRIVMRADENDFWTYAVPAIISKAKFTEYVQKSFSSARITILCSAGLAPTTTAVASPHCWLLRDTFQERSANRHCVSSRL